MKTSFGWQIGLDSPMAEQDIKDAIAHYQAKLNASRFSRPKAQRFYLLVIEALQKLLSEVSQKG